MIEVRAKAGLEFNVEEAIMNKGFLRLKNIAKSNAAALSTGSFCIKLPLVPLLTSASQILTNTYGVIKVVKTRDRFNRSFEPLQSNLHFILRI